MLAIRATLWFARNDLKTRLACTLLLIFSAILPRAVAEEWISEQYRCALTLPTHESWVAATRQQLPVGEVVLNAASMTTSHGLMLTYVEEMPSSDLRNPSLVRRITELLESQGWSIESSAPLTWKDRPWLQFIAMRKDVVAGKQLGIVRATMRGKSLYVLTAYGKGEANRADDPEFMRVMETFRFVDHPVASVDHPVGPSVRAYRLAMFGAIGGAAMLIVAFAIVLLLQWRGAEDRA